MKLIRRISLGFQEGKSDKVYEVDLCEVGPDQFVVNFRYGRRGSALKDGSKTPLPVDLQKAEQVYEKLVSSKTKKGYSEHTGAPAPPSTSPPAPGPASLEKRKKKVLDQLRLAVDTNSAVDHRSLDRLLWSAGRLKIKEAAPILVSAAGNRSYRDRTEYCLIWAMGRCGDKYAVPLLKGFWQDKNRTI